MEATGQRTVGAVLAGGRGRRMGGDKAVVHLRGRPLAAYPVAALQAAGLAEVVLVAKAGSPVPVLPGVTVWSEPDEPRHPVVGLAHALRAAGGRAVFACAADMPLLDDATVRAVCAAAQPGDAAVVARAAGRLQPLCGWYAPAALERLRHFTLRPLVELVEELEPRVVDVEPAVVFNVNDPADLLQADALLG